jgi:formate C-acetyltransferase
MFGAHGSILNQTLHPSYWREREDRAIFRFIRTFMDLGGWHIQFNVLTTDSLREAQKKPEEYRGLVVRVAGYSAILLS